MIFKVTTRHAICAVIYLAENGVGRVVTTGEIARQRGIPTSYLPRILGKLAKHGVIRSFHGGRDKGYQIVRELDTISLFEILDIFEGWSEEGCLLRPPERQCNCNAKYFWGAIQEQMFAPLKKLTLRTVCGQSDSTAIREVMSV